MAASKYYPPLSSVVNLDQLPDALSSFISSTVLDKLLVKKISKSTNEKGDKSTTNLTLSPYTALSYDIAGTGMKLALNPSKDNTTKYDSSDFYITVNKRDGILALLNSDSLSYINIDDPKTILNYILDALGFSYADLYENIVSKFTYNAQISTVVSDINEFYSLATAISITETGDLDTDLESLLSAISSSEELVSLGKDALDIVYDIYLNVIDDDLPIETRINTLFTTQLGVSPIDRFKEMLVPMYEIILRDINLGIEFPRSILKPVNDNATKDAISTLKFNVGTLSFSTDYGFQFDEEEYASLTESYIGNTKIAISFDDLKLDLSTTSSIAEVTAAGYPDDFVGVYVGKAKVTLPPAWFESVASTSGQTLGIFGENLLLGTGGISGQFALKVVGAGGKSTNDEVTDKMYFNLGSSGNFKIGFSKFNITFQQGEITECDIVGSLTLPALGGQSSSANVAIAMSFDSNGNFNITASDTDGYVVPISDYITATLKTISVGKDDSKGFYLSASGALDFSKLCQKVGIDFLNSPITIDQLVVWEDGTFELKGLDGSFKLPKQETFSIGPATITVSAMSFSTYEQTYSGQLRKYGCFSFDGSISVNPGGVDARGDGIKLYFTIDGKSFHFFFRIQSLAVDIIIPGNATKDTASVLINGYLSMKDPSASGGNSKNMSTEYVGAIDLTLPKLKFNASSSMRLNPTYPSFFVDASISFPACFPLGTTGIGIYGFRAMLGQNYLLSKTAAGLTENASWYEFYKAKSAPEYAEGIHSGKFDTGDGFSLGAGLSLATAFDRGRVFSSKLFFMLGLPDTFMIEGQANFLSDRVDLDTQSDPPFYAVISISSKSIYTLFGADINIPSGNGFIASVSGSLEATFLFGNARGWSLNIGMETPEERRIRAKIFTLFHAYFYFMISNSGIRAGAGASWNFNKSIGPLGIKATAYLDMAGRISYKPVQIGGSIAVGGSLSVHFWKFGFGFGLDAGLSAEAPKPFVISGYFSAYIKFRIFRWKKKIPFTIPFTWSFNESLDKSEVQVLDASTVKAVNMLTGETYPLYVTQRSTLNSRPTLSATTLNSYTIPVDSYIDFQFNKGVGILNEGCLSRFESAQSNTTYWESVSPQQAKMPQVFHIFYLSYFNIFARNVENGAWEKYDVYSALTPMIEFYAKNEIATGNNGTLPYGCWQSADVGINNKLRVLARSPLSFVGKADDITPEELGFSSTYLICAANQKTGTEVLFDDSSVAFDQDAKTVYRGLIVVVTGADGSIDTFTNSFGLSKALSAGGTIDIYFPQSSAQVKLFLGCLAESVTLTTYNRADTGNKTYGNLTEYDYVQLEEVTKTAAELSADTINGLVFGLTSDMVDALDYTENAATEENSDTTDTTTLAGDLLLSDNKIKTKLIDRITIKPMGIYEFTGFIEQESEAMVTQENTGLLLLEDANVYQNNIELFEVKMLSLDDYMYNLTLKSQERVAATGNILKTGFEKSIQPIWRPNTEYLIQVQTIDLLSNIGYYAYNYNFLFRTAGPVGHFHQYKIKGSGGADVTVTNPTYASLLAQNNEDQFKLAYLKYYIDMNRSYPNADGRLTNSKPLFYGAPSFQLFYINDYVYSMFNNYDAYPNTSGGAVTSNITLVIKDPTEKLSTSTVIVQAPIGEVVWVEDSNSTVSNDVKIINNMISNATSTSTNCSGITTIQKISYSQKFVPQTQSLDPDKLYTAQFMAVYKGSTDNAEDSVMVHSYNFKTSVYKDFKAQIQSYYSTSATGNLYAQKIAIDASYITEAKKIVTQTESSTSVLLSQYADRFDRLVTGALRIPSLVAATATDITVVWNTNTTTVVGLLVRSTEPFNDPKISENILLGTDAKNGNSTKTIGMGYAGEEPSDTFVVIHSIDRTMAFITNANMSIESGLKYDLTFKYLEYNGATYTPSSDSPQKLPVSFYSVE